MSQKASRAITILSSHHHPILENLLYKIIQAFFFLGILFAITPLHLPFRSLYSVMHNVNIRFPDLGPEALEAVRSCPAARFIQNYKTPPQTNIPGSIEVEPEIEPLIDVNGCDV